MATIIRKVKTTDLELKDRLVSIQRVTKVTKGGRTFSFSAIVVVGNENGIVGYGLGKPMKLLRLLQRELKMQRKTLLSPVIKALFHMNR
jgi:small subunit ribosomal protein S5